MNVNISGWDGKCSDGCDKRYALKIEADPDPLKKEEFRESHLHCLSGCFS
jgi:hypothetical protein